MNDITMFQAMPISRRAVLTGAASLAVLASAGVGHAQTNEKGRDVVLITGTSSGFGRLMAEDFARAGAQVVASMRDVKGRNAKAAEELRALAATENISISVVEIDVLDDQSIASGMAEGISKFGRIDVLINNAGITVPGPIELQPQAAFQANIDTNAGGLMRMTRAVAPHMRQAKQGTIVQISSALARFVDPSMSGYAASKTVGEVAADALSYELAPFNIEVSILQVCGPYPTGLQEKAKRNWDEMLSDAGEKTLSLLEAYKPQIDNMLGNLPADPSLDPQEISDAVVKLVSLPFGSRPGRVAVGPYANGITGINTAHEQLQAALHEHSPIAGLIKPV